MTGIRHPGPPVARRYETAHCDVSPATVHLAAGDDLLDALSRACEGWDGAAVDLAGLRIGPYAYVMPDVSTDGWHAAWYSPTHSGQAARIDTGTAMMGSRDGAPWFHAHAVWHDTGRRHMGHLRPGEVTVAQPATLPLWRWRGAALELDMDPETGFPIYHLRSATPPTQDQERGQTAQAVLIRLAPHQDLHTCLSQVHADLSLPPMRIIGLGSLIGATFEDTPAMASPISEALIGPDARMAPEPHIPVWTVDPQGQLFDGTITKDGGAVLVTFELLLVPLVAHPAGFNAAHDEHTDL